MSKEKFIRGKHDNGRHDGRYANVKREAAAEAMWREVWPELVEAAEKGELEPEDEFHPLDKGSEIVYPVSTSG